MHDARFKALELALVYARDKQMSADDLVTLAGKFHDFMGSAADAHAMQQMPAPAPTETPVPTVMPVEPPPAAPPVPPVAPVEEPPAPVVAPAQPAS